MILPGLQMKLHVYKVTFSLIICCLSLHSIKATTIGSDTAVNRFNSSQTLFNGDRVAGFAALNGGFSLFGAGTVATWDSFFPVCNQIALNAGHLILNTDLLLNDAASIKTLGRITGQNHLIDLSPSTTLLVTQADVDAGCAVSFLTSAGFGAAVTSVAWSFDSRFVAVGTAANLLGAELFLYSFDGSTLTLQASLEVGVTINALAWHPTKYNLAVGSSNNLLSGELGVFDINPDAPNLGTILTNYEYSANVTALAYHPSGNYLALGGSNGSRELMLFVVNANGSLVTGGALGVNLTVAVSAEALSWDQTGTYLAVGTIATGTDNELRVYTLNTGSFTLTLNSSLNLGAVGAVAWHPLYSTILAVGTAASPRLRWYRHNPTAGTLTQIGTISTNLNGTAVNDLWWNPDGECLALVQNGSSPGGEFIIYSFNFTTTTLTEFQSVEIGSNCQTVCCSANGNYVGFGSTNNTFYVYQRTEPSFLDQCFTFSNVTIFLNNDLSLQSCCLNFVENCQINGQGFMLDMQPTATLTVGSNGTLTLKDIIINGVGLNNIRCADATASLILKDVTFNLTNNYNFSAGEFNVIGNFLIKGDNKIFSYLTDQISVISSYSSLALGPTTTFFYAPSTNTRDRLSFQDSTAQLILNSATFSTTTTGIALLKGSLLVDGESNLSPTVGGSAITFGNGLQSINNMRINIQPAAQLIVTGGRVENKNV